MTAYDGGPVEFERAVPPSGNMEVTGRQFWLGPRRSGQVITFWSDTDVIHLIAGGLRSSRCAPTCAPPTWAS